MIRKKVARNVFNLIYRVISTAVITLSVIVGVLYLCGIRPYYVKSGSMGELLPVGCVCFVSTYSDFHDISAGDVISFRVSDDMLVTHRAVRITARGIVTQGDENDSPDPDPVTEESYIGKTVFAIPRVGVLLNRLHSPVGIAVTVAVIILLFIAGFFYQPKETQCL